MGKPQQSKLDEGTLSFATIPELAQALRQHQITSSELAKFFGKRLETIGPNLNALACSTMKRAKDDWGDVDYEFKRERFRGPLQGIPYGVKDLIAVAGYPTTWGAKPYANQTFDKDAAVVDRLDGADAILIGKLSMVELAGGGGYSSASASLTGTGSESVESPVLGRRIFKRLGSGRCGGISAVRAWVRDVGIHPDACVLLWSDGIAPDVRLSESPWRHGALLDFG